IHKADGSIVIQITSNEVIREPFLDFLLEVEWPQGRMLREFTVLLDPPLMFAETVKPAQELPEVAQTRIGRTDSDEEGDARVEAAGSQYGPVARGESLWAIADRLKLPGVTTEQMAMALFKANPEAFSEVNINTLKAGVILRIPDREALVGLSPAQARREFQRQYQTWLAHRAPRPEAPPTLGQEPTEDVSARAKLKLEAPKEAELTPGQLEAPVVEGPTQSDPQTQAVLESLKQENEALKARLEALEGKLALLELRQAELARLQAQAEQSANAVQPSPSEETSTPARETVPVQTSAQKPAEPEKAELKPVPTPESKSAAEEHFLPSEWLDEPVYLFLGGGSLILLGIAGWMIWQRRQAAESQADSLLVGMDQQDSQKADEDTVGTAPAAAGMSGIEVAESSFLSEFTPSDFDILEGESVAVDPLAEADVYLAYGRYNQAEELIRQALAEDPQRPELRLKLLEIFYAKDDSAAFEAYAQELKNQGADRDPKFWEKVVDMGRELCPQSTLFGSDEVRAEARSEETFRTAGGGALSGENSGLEFGFEEAAQTTSTFEKQLSEDIDALEFNLSDFDLGIPKKGVDSPKPAIVEENDQGIAFSFHLENPAEDASESEISFVASDLQEEASDHESFDLTDMDELDTKLDLARAYVDMEDIDAAKEILEEVFARGSEKQKQEAKTLLDKLGLTS
ncbi:MAG: FimV/HubP family polar landmark protein, partial [Methylohalobius sp.]